MSQVPDFVPFGGYDVCTVETDQAGIMVLPVCYEEAPSYGSGSKEGPYHILDASVQLEDMDEETWRPWHQKGVYTLQPLTPQTPPARAVAEISRAAAAILQQQKFMLALGGDHAVTIGLVQAAAQQYPGVGVLQIDAHMDLRDSWNGSPFNHACVMRRLHGDAGLNIVQVGIRSFSSEEADYVRSNGLKPWMAHDLLGASDSDWIRAVVAALPPLVYITLDLDGLDPSVIPGTGTPEPGGLGYRQVVALLKEVGRRRQVVGADITELVKMDGCRVSEFTAAKLATKIFMYCAGPVSSRFSPGR